MAGVLAALAGLAGCGSGDTGVDQPRPSVPATTTTIGLPAQAFVAETTTTDGYRYRVTLALGDRSTAAAECVGPAGPGGVALPVTLTVSNLAPDRPAPFPPLRIELLREGSPPVAVPVREPSGACTFAPRVSHIRPGESVAFAGSTPAIDTTAAPGTAGRVTVSLSESRFSLSAPIP